MFTEAQKNIILKTVGDSLAEKRNKVAQGGDVKETQKLDALIAAFATPPAQPEGEGEAETKSDTDSDTIISPPFHGGESIARAFSVPPY